jgi:hypothetical protein
MVACLAVSVAGCRASYPAPPTQIFRPKIVGVIDTVTITRSLRRERSQADNHTGEGEEPAKTRSELAFSIQTVGAIR